MPQRHRQWQQIVWCTMLASQSILRALRTRCDRVVEAIGRLTSSKLEVAVEKGEALTELSARRATRRRRVNVREAIVRWVGGRGWRFG